MSEHSQAAKVELVIYTGEELHSELLAKLTATTLFVIPAYAGIQSFGELPTNMDPRFHGDDDFCKSLL